MTRVTDFGRKRTFVQAGFGETVAVEEQVEDEVKPGLVKTGGEGDGDGDNDDEPPKKKRKRVRKKKVAAKNGEEGEGKDGGMEGEEDKDVPKKGEPVTSNKALKKKKRREKEKERAQRRLLSSEMRRQKRTQERNAETTCFACREKGHAAKDCPKVKSDSGHGGGAGAEGKGKRVVGICYRCGSTRHTLAKCRKPVDGADPLPFASCFVCNGKGHLASSCPQNKDKGIYPNGGCCKLCGEKTHLAKDCELRTKDTMGTLAVMGTSDQPGADEDDFHTFKRRRSEVEKDIKTEDSKKKLLQLKTGAHSGVTKSFGEESKVTKKVVYF